MADLSKEAHISVRTTSQTKQQIKSLSDRVADHKWEFPHDSSIQRCASMSGIVHELISGNITIPKIEQHLNIVEEN